MAAVCDPATSHLGSLAFPPGGQGQGVLCGPSGSQSLQALWTWTWGRCFLITVPLPLLPQWWAEPYYPSPESLAPQFKGERFFFFFPLSFSFPSTVIFTCALRTTVYSPCPCRIRLLFLGGGAAAPLCQSCLNEGRFPWVSSCLQSFLGAPSVSLGEEPSGWPEASILVTVAPQDPLHLRRPILALESSVKAFS